MVKVVNLRRARKQKARDAKLAKAGTPETRSAAAVARQDRARLEGHKLDREPSPRDTPGDD